MLYILNVILPTKRNFRNAITALYGIGRIRAEKLASILGLHPSAKIEEITQRRLNNIGRLIERAFLIDFELRRKISLTKRVLIKIRSYRGFCHVHGLPTRGQRTHTNGSTAHKLLREKIDETARPSTYFKSNFKFKTARSFNKGKKNNKKNNNKNKKK